MRLFRNLNQLPTFNNTVITIGTFDGVHYGHQQILHRLNELAIQHQGESMLITFHPHPRSIVNNKNSEIRLLSTLEEKFELVARYGIDNMVVVPFTREFSEQSAQAYIADFLVKNFNPKKIVIGYNHRFGKNRAGGIDLLHKMSQQLGYEVEEISQQTLANNAVSSTKIRKALQQGDIPTAIKLLQHEYTVQGLVVKGNQIGGKIGFPTANIQVNYANKLIPDNGVYAVLIHLHGLQYQGMMNIGLRPTINGNSKTIEVNIFDFDENIYGEKIKVEFVQLIRREQKFANLQALIAQLNKDKKACLSLLGK